MVVIFLGRPALVNCWNIITTEKTRSFEFPLHINCNGTISFDIDVSFDLTVTYHKGALVVDEPIEFWGKAVLVGDNTENIEYIQLGFQNALLYNSTTHDFVRDQWGIPEQAYLFFTKSDSGLDVDKNTGKIVSYMLEKTSMVWTINGNYKPTIVLVYEDNNKSIMTIQEIILTVSPRDQLIQIQTNEVNTYLSLAVFIFSFFSVINIFLDLWRWGDKTVVTVVAPVAVEPKQEEPSKPEETNEKEL